MWFRNLQLYRLPKDWALASHELDAQLAKRALQACAPSDMQSLGWVDPAGRNTFVHSVNRQWLIALGAEQKLLPTTIVRQFAKDRAAEIEEREGRKVGRKEMRDLREQVTAELLPRAFVRRRSTLAWIDPINGWLAVDAGARGKADELVEFLIKTVSELPIKTLKLTHAPAARMTTWVETGEAPAGFTVDQDLELRSPEEATIRYARHTLEGEEIRRHIAKGKSATKLGMTWADRISFVLADSMQIKRLAFLDVLKEASEKEADNDDDRFDLDFTLMAGELARLLEDLVEALGGEEGSPK